MNRQAQRHPDRHGVTVALGFCHPGQVAGAFCESALMTLMADRRVTSIISRESGPRVAEARNEIITQFLFNRNITEAEWLWFADADMVWQPDALDRLLAVADRSSRPIVGGLCFAGGKKGGEVFPTLYRLNDETGGAEPIKDYPKGVVKVDMTGAAFLLIHWSVLARMGEAFDTLPNGVKNPYRWFVEGMASKAGEPYGEDIAFCIKANSLGIPVYVDTAVVIGHRKSHLLTEENFLEHKAGESDRQMSL